MSSLLISVLPNGLDIEEARDIVLDEFEAGTDAFATIDCGAYENISYSLDLANIGGTELGVFTLFRGGSGNTATFAYIFISSVQGFSDGFASSQKEILISGEPIFDGVDGEGLQSQLEQNAGSAPASDDDAETPEVDEDAETLRPDEGETPDADGGLKSRDRDEQRTPGGDKADPTEDTGDRGNGSIDDEFLELGVVEDGVYESPQFGTEITWNNDWAINENVDEPVESDTDANFDVLTLSGELNAYLSVEIHDASEIDPADLVELWTSEAFLDEIDTLGSEPDEVVLEDSGRDIGAVVILADLDDGTQIIVYREAVLVDDGDSIAIIQFIQIADEARDGITSA